MINGVIINNLITHIDERGFFRELIRTSTDLLGQNFGQLSHSLVFPGIIKAWHLHKIQSQWTYVASGSLKVVLCDCRPQSDTFHNRMEFLAGDYQPACIYLLPPGVAHGYRCIYGPANVIYVTSGVYDVSEEERILHNDPSIGYDWLKDPEIR